MDVNCHYTAQNQIVLREYADKIAQQFHVQEREKPGLIWSIIGPYIPSLDTAGYMAGKAIADTHGQNFSNATIDFVMEKIFHEEIKQVSTWQLLKDRVTGVAQKSLTEGIKLCVTPKVMPVMSAFCGVTGQIALPLVVTFVGFVYDKAMNNPEQIKKLGELPLEQLFSIDSETGRFKDGFGNLYSYRDMHALYQGAAEYNLVGQLIELCHQIDTEKAGGDRSLLAIEKLQKLVATYQTTREDGAVVFPDGAIKTSEEEKIIADGIEILKDINPRHEKKQIRKMIQVLARHSVLPFQNLSLADLDGNTPKRMPVFFTDKENEWKNYIVRAVDGKFFIYQDCGDKKKGQIVSKEVVQSILMEIQEKETAQILEMHTLQEMLLDPEQRDAFIEKLYLMDPKQMKAFLNGLIVDRQDGSSVYLDGKVMDPEEKAFLLKSIEGLPSRQNKETWTTALCDLLNKLGAHLPKDMTGFYVICCEDGPAIMRNGQALTQEEFEQIQATFAHI